MHKWLENFAFRTPIPWWVFAVAGVISVTIALATVTFRSYRAASKNPVEALRYE
jgi:putative ABC transport system permease protein